ncbi:DUF2294 domain-containing protein [Paenibacillus tarimensis]|uniref:DUF2294 domain-containing protein n=1 Tax=Paenibacillus tarimensis TaxID=416012 RepID=UPI001F3C5F50|nr:DUF2294 domain-containing protein [Paenibacillus tarimensis]MCF2944299.1 DUF2294 domain-containing protein [Paenibacillus tarimensis]
MRTKGMMEAEVSRALTQWERDFLGRGSVDVKTDIVRNMIVVMLKGVLTPAEKLLAAQKDGMLSVKRNRSELVETGADQLYQLIGELTGKQVVSFFTDISTRSGERIMVFILDGNLENELAMKKV